MNLTKEALMDILDGAPKPQEPRRITQGEAPKALNAQFIGRPEIDPVLINNIIKLLSGKTVTESIYILEDVGKWIKNNARVM